MISYKKRNNGTAISCKRLWYNWSECFYWYNELGRCRSSYLCSAKDHNKHVWSIGKWRYPSEWCTICVATIALGYSGILKGKKATTYHLNNGHRHKQLAEYDAIVVNGPFVRTDNIITSYCPQTGPTVAFMMLEELVGTDKM